VLYFGATLLLFYHSLDYCHTENNKAHGGDNGQHCFNNFVVAFVISEWRVGHSLQEKLKQIYIMQNIWDCTCSNYT
jgi:hypothetical protein